MINGGGGGGHPGMVKSGTCGVSASILSNKSVSRSKYLRQLEKVQDLTQLQLQLEYLNYLNRKTTPWFADI